MRGDTVRKIRLMHGLTQKELGRILGVTRAAIGLVEQGRMMMSPQLERKFRQALNVTPEIIAFVESRFKNDK